MDARHRNSSSRRQPRKKTGVPPSTDCSHPVTMREDSDATFNKSGLQPPSHHERRLGSASHQQKWTVAVSHNVRGQGYQLPTGAISTSHREWWPEWQASKEGDCSLQQRRSNAEGRDRIIDWLCGAHQPPIEKETCAPATLRRTAATVREGSWQ
jgi:hypothetical protein